jgi:hypothetical protein
MFVGGLVYDLDELREALALAPKVPLMTCDARDSRSAAKVLQNLITHTLNLRP